MGLSSSEPLGEWLRERLEKGWVVWVRGEVPYVRREGAALHSFVADAKQLAFNHLSFSLGIEDSYGTMSEMYTAV